MNTARTRRHIIPTFVIASILTGALGASALAEEPAPPAGELPRDPGLVLLREAIAAHQGALEALSAECAATARPDEHAAERAQEEARGRVSEECKAKVEALRAKAKEAREQAVAAHRAFMKALRERFENVMRELRERSGDVKRGADARTDEEKRAKEAAKEAAKDAKKDAEEKDRPKVEPKGQPKEPKEKVQPRGTGKGLEKAPGQERRLEGGRTPTTSG